MNPDSEVYRETCFSIQQKFYRVLGAYWGIVYEHQTLEDAREQIKRFRDLSRGSAEYRITRKIIEIEIIE